MDETNRGFHIAALNTVGGICVTIMLCMALLCHFGPQVRCWSDGLSLELERSGRGPFIALNSCRPMLCGLRERVGLSRKIAIRPVAC